MQWTVQHEQINWLMLLPTKIKHNKNVYSRFYLDFKWNVCIINWYWKPKLNSDEAVALYSDLETVSLMANITVEQIWFAGSWTFYDIEFSISTFSQFCSMQVKLNYFTYSMITVVFSSVSFFKLLFCALQLNFLFLSIA